MQYLINELKRFLLELKQKMALLNYFIEIILVV